MSQPGLDFLYQSLPHRVHFGVGRLSQLAAEVEACKTRRAMVLSTPGQRRLAEEMGERLGPLCKALHPHALAQVPYATIEAALKEIEAHDIDGLVAVGGGSTIGLAKGIALQTGLPIVAIPTTYAGSEMTQIWGISRDGHKSTGRDPRVKPQSVKYPGLKPMGL